MVSTTKIGADYKTTNTVPVQIKIDERNFR